MRREWPAYGRTIASHLVRGNRPVAVGVLFSNGYWDHFNHAPKVCIRADEWAMGRYEFGWVAGLHVVAIWGEATAEGFGELLLDLMQAQPALLWAVDLHGTLLWDETGDPFWPAQLAKLGLASTPCRLAQERYREGQRRAANRDMEEFAIIEARSGPDAAKRWGAARLDLPTRVRELFGAPFQDRSEPRAA